MKLWTDAFAENTLMPKRQELDLPDFGTHGDNVSPALYWADVPAEAQSLALTLYDPDAPTGSGFWHWVVVNIPVTTTGLPEDAGRADGSGLPAGALQLINDYGTRGFGGAAPPKGDRPHRYIFQLHALKVAHLPVPSDATNAVGRFMLHLNQLTSATYTGLYEIK